MAEATLKATIRQVLKTGYFSDDDDLVDVSDGDGEEDIHLIVVSRKLDGLDLETRRDIIWDLLGQHLTPEQWGRITMWQALSLEELRYV